MNDLNPEQQSAIQGLREGHVAVIAGPGSGKTHTLVSAIQERLESGIPAQKMLALTFTKKAAREMEVRLARSWAGEQPVISTFHAWVYGRVKPKGKSLMNDIQQRQVLASLKRSQKSRDLTVRDIGLLISRHKNHSDSSAVGRNLMEEYDRLLAAKNLLDYDDLLALYLAGATKPAGYEYIFVDEFQDTSPIQYEVLQRIKGRSKLFIIGDPNQSIYGFRGAKAEVFEQFGSDMRPAIVRLTTNYRSTKSIVGAANNIFGEVPQKALRTDEGRVRIVETLHSYSEADFIRRLVEQSLGGTDWQAVHHDAHQLKADSFKDFAVLYRTNYQGKIMAEKLRAGGLPIQIIGEDAPLLQPSQQMVVRTLLCLHQRTEDNTKQLDEVCEQLKLAKSDKWLNDIQPDSPAEVPALLQARVGLKVREQDAWQQLQNQLASLKTISGAITYFDTIAGQEFYDPAADRITLTTIHASKGLEFRHVFLAGCNDGILPSRYAIERDEVEEEKRLFYVAVTRAIETLTLLYSQEVATKLAEPSRFLQYLTSKVSREYDGELTRIHKRRDAAKRKHSQQSLL